MLKVEGSVNGCEQEGGSLAQAVGAAARHSQGGPCQQPVSWASGSNRSEESLGRELPPSQGAVVLFFLQPISQFPEEEDAVSVTCFNSKQTLVPRGSASPYPTGSQWRQNAKMGQPGQRAGAPTS